MNPTISAAVEKLRKLAQDSVSYCFIHIRSKVEAVAISGGLSNPSKMPCASWSISAKACRVGSALQEIPGSVCSLCYALSGTYLFKSTKNALERRLERLTSALASPEASVEWCGAMIRLIRLDCHKQAKRGDSPVFRWFDSGDLQNVRHLELISAIAYALPEVDFWLPTRETGIIAEYLGTYGEFPSNLHVKVSRAMIDDKRPARTGLQWSETGVHTLAPAEGFLACPASTQGNVCGDCRACWSDTAVSYLYHGKGM